MQAARMSFEEEVVKLRSECRGLRIRNNNLERKNTTLNLKVQRLVQENHQLSQKVNLLEQKEQFHLKQLEQQRKQIENLNLIVEELRIMVFGKKRKTNAGEDTSSGDSNDGMESNGSQGRKNANRTKESYRRSTPSDKEVTDTFKHPLKFCPDCGVTLLQMKQVIRYIEDLQDLEKLHQLLKRVEKHLIETGFCPRCKRRKSAISISPQTATLGKNVKKFISYLVIVMRLSLEQVRCLLKDTANLTVSDGEIIGSLDAQANKLTHEVERIKLKIRAAPGRHYDETGWKVQQEGLGNYCWISRPTDGEDTIFLMGRSRGKGNAEELQGEIDNQVGISDDYPAYDNLFAKHQLCMAHPNRKLKDLAQSKTLTFAPKLECIKSHEVFAALYQNLEQNLKAEYQKAVWLKRRDGYIKRLREIAVVTDNDPDKLKAIKRSLNDNAEKYFTCLLQPGIPADNNKAERGLRHIVLKRKSSYGSKTQKGADTMSILCSTLLSCWWNKPQNFFVAYNRMLTP